MIKRLKFFKFKDGYGNPLFILDEGYKIEDRYFDAIGRDLGDLGDLKRYIEYCGCKFNENAVHEWCDLTPDGLGIVIESNKKILELTLRKA